MKYTRWNIDKVNKFVQDNSECILITTEYKNLSSKMKFRCGCGNEFETSFDKFKNRNKRQCNQCGRKRSSLKQRLPFREIKDFIECDSGSGCKLLSDNYSNAHDKLSILCKCGKQYKVSWKHFKHSNQRQCPECSLEIRAEARRLPIEEVVGAIEGAGCSLISEYKNIDSRIDIQCSCGKMFQTSFGLFRDLDINACESCRGQRIVTSKGEDKIRNWLDANGIDYREEYTFDNLRHINKLRFDFAIMNGDNVRMLIEYDGAQHYGLGNFSDDTNEMIQSYSRTIASDHKKNEFCFRNGIPLLRIPYDKYKNISFILKNTLLK